MSGMNEHSHIPQSQMSLLFIKAPNFPYSHLITPPPILGSQHTCTQYEPLALPTTSHTHHTHMQFAGPAHVFLSPRPRHHSVSCVHQQASHMSHPSYTHRVLFHSTWSFMTTGFPEHFTFPSVVQQMCLNGMKRKKKSGGAGNAFGH